MTDELGSTVETEVVAPEVKTEIEVTKSMDDTLRDALAGIRSKETEQEQNMHAQDKAPISDEEKAARIRDEKGKFAAADKGAPTPEPAANTEAAPVTVSPEIQRLGFRKEEAEAFAAAPEALKAAILRRSDEMFKGIEQYKKSHEYAVTMDKAIQPYMNTIRALNISPDQAISGLLEADNILRNGQPQQKSAYLAQLAQNYGIDLQSVAALPPQAQPDPALSHLTQQVNQLQQHLKNQELQSQKQQQDQLNSQITAFASDPNHSHFENVKGHMAALLQAGQAKDLADAYEQAIYANPTTRAAVLAKQQADAQAEASKKAQAAKSAASTNITKRPSMPVAQPIGTMEQTIAAKLKQLRAA